jgi:hypothetical protein
MFVKRKDAEQADARRLRAELGWSVARIARELGVAKSSVSVWVRNVIPAEPSPRAPKRPPGAIPTRRLHVWRSGQVRHCGRCDHDLPLELFNRLGDGHQWWCRSCFAAYFQARGDLHRRQSNAAKQARTRVLHAHVVWYLLAHPCVDCGEDDPVVLEFDHVGEKTAGISALITACVTVDVLDREIEQCEVVCVNCHRRRTAQRARWRRADPSETSRRPYANASVARNFAHLDALLRESGCVDCGEGDPVVLDFDHIGPKRAKVTTLAWYGCSVATIDAEVAQCEVRCANCHRRATAKRAGYYRTRAVSSDVPP